MFAIWRSPILLSRSHKNWDAPLTVIHLPVQFRNQLDSAFAEMGDKALAYEGEK